MSDEDEELSVEAEQDGPMGAGRTGTTAEIVYIAGWGHSGTTLLDLALGTLPGFTSCGEIHGVWQSGILDRQPCSCGEQVEDCERWSPILEHVIGPVPSWPDAARHIIRLQKYAFSERYTLGRTLHDGRRGVAEYKEISEGIYRGIVEATGCRTIVDSSKLPTYAPMLDAMDGIALSYVHIIRDPRGTAYSWAHPRRAEDKRSAATTPRMPVLESSLRWVLRNVLSERIARRGGLRSFTMTYEDLARKPDETFQALLAFLDRDDLGTVDLHELKVGQTHIVQGNPIRFDSGHIRVGEDLRWRSGMSPLGKALVSLVTLPYLKRYGYPVRAS